MHAYTKHQFKMLYQDVLVASTLDALMNNFCPLYVKLGGVLWQVFITLEGASCVCVLSTQEQLLKYLFKLYLPF